MLNTPFLKEEMLRNLIEKIFLSKKNSNRKFYIIIINVDVILKKINLYQGTEILKIIRKIQIGFSHLFGKIK